MPPRRPVLLSAAARVLARAAAIQLEDAAAAAGPVAVRSAQALAARRASVGEGASVLGDAASAPGVHASSEMFPAPSWRRRPTREPDYARRQPPPAGAASVPLASASTPLAGAKLYGGREAPVLPEAEDNDPHDLTVFSLSDPFDLPDVRRIGSEDDDPHDLSAATRWSLSDPLDEAPRVTYKPKPFKPVFIEGEDNDPHDLSAATPWSLSDPFDLDEARQYLRRLDEDDNDPHDLSAATSWSMSDPLDHPREFKRLQSRLGKAEDDDPHDLAASTRWSLGDPTDHEMLARKQYTPPEFKPVYVDRVDSPTDLTAATAWSMSDPLDFPGAREVKTLSRAKASARSKPVPEHDNDPHDLMASTRWSLGDPTDQEILARSKQTTYKPPEFKPVFVGRSDVGLPPTKRDRGDSPHDLSASTRWSMSDPLDYDEPVREIKGEPTPTEATPSPVVEPTPTEATLSRVAEPAAEAKPVSATPPTTPTPSTDTAPSVAPATPAVGSTISDTVVTDPLASLPRINRDPNEERVALRSSTVPTSRLGRLFHYGSLGLSLGLGAATESIRRTAGGSGTGSVFMSDANVRRLVATLGRMRGAALKLGQFMSIQDNTMLPPEIERVLQQVQDHANYMPEWQMEKVLRAELGDAWESLFAAFDRVPVAAASIGQVHRATLADGTPVAVKIQFPGVAGSISSDLANVSLLLRGSAVLPKGLYLQNTIAVARRELEDECDYIREGAAGARFHRLLEGDPVFDVPRVIDEATTGKVLTTEWMGGRPLSKMRGMSQEQRDLVSRQWLTRAGSSFLSPVDFADARSAPTSSACASRNSSSSGSCRRTRTGPTSSSTRTRAVSN